MCSLLALFAAATAANQRSLPTPWPATLATASRISLWSLIASWSRRWRSACRRRRCRCAERGIEVALLGFGVDFEERRQSAPDHAQRIDVGAIDLLEHREKAALLV
jgi:hypothetical protein